MSKINNTIGSFGGHQYRSCYHLLREAIEVGISHQPDSPQMKVIWMEVCQKTGKKPGTVARALARAVEDLWDYGDSGKLIAYYQSWEKCQPTPQEFIFIVSRHLWLEDEAQDV